MSHWNGGSHSIPEELDTEEPRQRSTRATTKMARVCYFGHYDPDYPRNRILKKALRRAGAEIIELNDRSPGLRRMAKLLALGLRTDFDVVLVGFPGHTDVPVARALCNLKRKPLLFDAFLSLYDSVVLDRQQQGNVLGRWKLFYIDKLACHLADLVLLDTYQHICFFRETFGIHGGKFRRIWAGSDDSVIYPSDDIAQGEVFTIMFCGSFIPLHGVETIIRTAHRLEAWGEPVVFQLVGRGQTHESSRALASSLCVSNVQFVDGVAYTELRRWLSRADVCLGIFGTTEKAGRVIPYKVFDALAAGRPIITADTAAVREALTHQRDIWLVPAGNVEALCEAIVFLRAHAEERASLARRGLQTFREKFSIDRISQDMARILMDFSGWKPSR